MGNDLNVPIQTEEELSKALQAAEDIKAQYEQTFSMISDIVWRYEVNAQGEHVGSYISPVADRMLGLPDGTIGDSFDKYFSYVHPDDLPALQEMLSERTRTPGTNKTAEYRLRKADGTKLRVCSRLSAYSHADGRVAILGTTSEIFKRNEAEEAQRKDCVFAFSKDLPAEHEAQQLFEQIFRKNPAMIALSTLYNPRFADVNDAFLKALGYSRDDIIGKKVGELGLFPHQDRQYRIADKLKADRHISNIELQVRRKDGTILEGLFTGEVVRFQDQEYFLTLMIDITERKRVEAALKESEERFRHVSEQITDFAFSYCKSPDGPFIIDWVTGAIEKITGYTVDEFHDMTFWMTIVAEDDLAIFDKSVFGLSPGESARCEIRIRKKDGGMVWLASFVECIADPQRPSYHRIYGSCCDITERKRAERALWQQKEMLQTIFDSVPVMIAFLDHEGSHQLVNRCWQSTLGWSSEDQPACSHHRPDGL